MPRKQSSRDVYARGLKVILLNKKGYSAAQLTEMREAARLLALLEGFPTGATGDSGSPPAPDPLLESLKAKYLGGSDANPQN